MIGDFLEVLFRKTGIKWLVNKIVVDILGYESCGCDERRKKLNDIQLNWEDRWIKK